jgi:hypothetical protein
MRLGGSRQILLGFQTCFAQRRGCRPPYPSFRIVTERCFPAWSVEERAMRNQGLAPDPTNEIVVVDVRNRAVRKANHDLIAVAGDDTDVLISRSVLEVTVRLACFQSS